MPGHTRPSAGGGVGGLFVPLVVAGALLGGSSAARSTPSTTSLFTVIGVAAFLGAGYRVPLAAVMFVAETTGQPGFVVPGLLAAVAAELVMGGSSVTTYQRAPDPGNGEATRRPAPDRARGRGTGGLIGLGSGEPGHLGAVDAPGRRSTGQSSRSTAVSKAKRSVIPAT